MLRATIWIGILALLMLGLGLLLVRPAVAVVCPQCFGLSKAADGLYVESAMSPAARSHAAGVISAAQQDVASFFSEERFKPRALVCATDACYQRIGGAPGSGTGILGSFALVVSPEAVNKVAVTEALAHVEMRGRVGTWKMQMGAVPEWFEQGLAVVVADDPLYIKPPTHADRCLAGSFPDMPATPSEWQDELQQEGDVLYAQSACQTVMWVGSHGGSSAVTALLTKVASGTTFQDAFR
jgi:hypothetical protein